MKAKTVNISSEPPKKEETGIIEKLSTLNKDNNNTTVSTEETPAVQKKDALSRIRESIYAQKNKLTRKNFIIAGCVIAGVITIVLLYYIFFIYFKPAKKVSAIVTINSSYILPEKINTATQSLFTQMTLFKDINQPATETNPLNGVLLTKKEYASLMERRPIAIMIDNQITARPQHNISQADIVYEALTEGGISRLMPIFWSKSPNKVGPIRSARQYFLEWLSPYSPLFTHDGCANSSDERVNACGNIVAYSLLDMSTKTAWRDYSDGRFAPHNEYVSPSAIWQYAKDNDYGGSFPDGFTSWKFSTDALLADRGEGKSVKVKILTGDINYGQYDVVWTYDRATNTYKRTIGGANDIDAGTNKQISPKTVIVEENEIIFTNDSLGHVIVNTIGQGNAKILMNGNIYNATWKKNSRVDRTIYYNEKGEEFTFNRGQIWIISISKTDGYFEIINQ